MFILGILFPGYFSTDLKCVRNATLFPGLFFSIPYKQSAQNKAQNKAGREQTEELQDTWAQRDAGNFKLDLLKPWIGIRFKSTRNRTESREEQHRHPHLPPKHHQQGGP